MVPMISSIFHLGNLISKIRVVLIGLAVVFLTQFCWAIPVDNGVEGEPEIECGPQGMAIVFNTRNPFEGHVFVKGRFAEEDCRSDEGGASQAVITLGFTECGMARSRSLNPLGMFVGVTVVITFHPKFITKVDRAYSIQCFYMEADKTVSTDIEVSMLTTGLQTEVVPMPVCRYEILDSADGQPVRYAIVGQAVYHKWTCDTETTDIFCMTVHSCFVDNGQGGTVDLVDPTGCALDRYLLGNLEYLTDLMAGKEAHVFKYADKAQLIFQCQVTISIKEPNGECALPACTEPTRGRRDASEGIENILDQRRNMVAVHSVEIAGTTDVSTGFSTLDLLDTISMEPVSSSRSGQMSEDHKEDYGRRGGAEGIGDTVCVNTIGLLWFAISISLTAVFSCVIFCFLFATRHSKQG